MTIPIRSLLKKSLEEDLGSGDLTTRTLVPKNLRGEAVIIAKAPGVLAGGSVACEVFRLRDRGLQVKANVREGVRLKKGRKVMTVRGRIRSILEAERVALNFLGRLSGIATLTRQFVDRVRGTPAKIYDTRKTTPLWRALEKDAVRCGGGENHRFGLWDEILVKDNHWAALASLRGGLKGRRSNLNSEIASALSGMPPRNDVAGLRALAMTAKRRKIPVEVEVQSLKQLAHLLEGPFVPDRILLDNFSVRELKRAVLFVKGLDQMLRTRYGLRRKAPLLEASGGVTLENVRAVAETGVDRISVGRLTHSAPALDFSLELKGRW